MTDLSGSAELRSRARLAIAVGAAKLAGTTTMIPQPDGRLHLAQERSIMGGPWEKAGEVYYIKRK